MIKRIEEIESEATFKAFLIAIGFHSYDEYMKLFGNNIFKRKEAVERYLESYKQFIY